MLGLGLGLGLDIKALAMPISRPSPGSHSITLCGVTGLLPDHLSGPTSGAPLCGVTALAPLSGLTWWP